jgi:hypothetical protein
VTSRVLVVEDDHGLRDVTESQRMTSGTLLSITRAVGHGLRRVMSEVMGWTVPGGA